MIYTLTFTKNRRPYTENGQVVERKVEAESKTAAIYHADTVKFCADNDCRVRSVSP